LLPIDKNKNTSLSPPKPVNSGYKGYKSYKGYLGYYLNTLEAFLSLNKFLIFLLNFLSELYMPYTENALS
jgi:hypothetical protein